MLPKFILVLVLVGVCQGAFENCDFFQRIEANRKYFITSPNAPFFYPPGISCRWYYVSPLRTKISLVCEEFNLPESPRCRLDRLGVSRRGRLRMSDAEYFCGNGKLEVLSKKNRLNVVLLSTDYSTGGFFNCHLQAKQTIPSIGGPANSDNCNCGSTNEVRIVGGTETSVNYYPMMAALIDTQERILFCGATIISPKFVITAAHCLSNKVLWRVNVLVGDHDISVGNDTDSARLYKTQWFFSYPDYNPLNHKNDIALVKIWGYIQFGREVGPACLPFANVGDTFAGQTVHALGWGSTEYGGPVSDKLLSVPLDVISLENCRATYGELVTHMQICTYRQDKDACQSDSGGPLLWKDPLTNVVKVIGIISYGIRCATTNPSVNTRVGPYLDWITDTTREAFCVK